MLVDNQFFTIKLFSISAESKICYH